MPNTDKTPQAPEPDVVPSELAIPVPPVEAAAGFPNLPEHPGPIQPTPPVTPAANAPIRARFHGGPGQSLTPLLIARREEDGSITEKIYYTPGRDLTEDEWNDMPAEHRDYVRNATNAYTVETDNAMRSSKRAASKDKSAE